MSDRLTGQQAIAWAIIRQRAYFTARGAGGADFPSKQHQPVAKIVAFFRREDFAQLLFHLIRVFGAAQPQTVGNPDTMSVGDYGGLAVYVPDYQVGGFAADTRQFCQHLDCVGDYAAVHPDNHFCHSFYVPCFCPVQTAGADKPFKLAQFRVREILYCRVALKQRGGNHVHPGVCALGGKPSRDKQLKWVAIFKRAFWVGVSFLQDFNYYSDSFSFFHVRSILILNISVL